MELRGLQVIVRDKRGRTQVVHHEKSKSGPTILYVIHPCVGEWVKYSWFRERWENFSAGGSHTDKSGGLSVNEPCNLGLFLLFQR